MPVVGERYEILGLITAGDALNHLPSRQLSTESESEPEGQGAPVRAHDVMTGNILCLSGEQALTEAANMMVNRDVDQLLVVRAGELVGFLIRESVLRILFTSQKDS